MRCIRHAAVGIAVLLASSCRAGPENEEPPRVTVGAQDSSWFTERDVLLAELSRREAQWAAQRPNAYRFRATWAIMAHYRKGDVMAVNGRPLVVCDTTGVPADTDTRATVGLDVPALFESIRTELADTTQGVMVRFDPTLGFPLYIQIDNRWMTDVGYLRMVEDFRAIPEDRAQCAAI